MGYHLTILRTKDGKEKPIALTEVEAAVASLPGFVIKPGTRGDIEIVSSTPNKQETLLIWDSRHGDIWTKNPERTTLEIMLSLAKKLNARVRGDELETYKTPDESYSHPDDFVLIQTLQQQVNRTKYKQWLWYGIIMSFFVLLGLFVHYFSR